MHSLAIKVRKFAMNRTNSKRHMVSSMAMANILTAISTLESGLGLSYSSFPGPGDVELDVSEVAARSCLRGANGLSGLAAERIETASEVPKSLEE